MRAYRLLDWQRAGFADVDPPSPASGQVLVRVGGVGLCHSDLLFLDSPAGTLPYDVPFTLGHEIAGWVEAVGPDVAGWSPGAAVAVACMSPCRECRWCRRGADNYCVEGWRGRGFGRDGGLASHVVATADDVVPLGGLDPRAAAPLTDAGATSYHAVQRVRGKLHDDSTAVVIGVGGLGGFAVQWLRLSTAARVVAVDVREERLAAARRLGAHEVVAGGDGMTRRLRDALGPHGADAVLDFVGTDRTMGAAVRIAAPTGSVAVVGQGFGSVQIGWGRVAHDVDLFIPQGATLAELREVVALAEAGCVVVEVERFPLADVEEAYRRLRAGTLDGRAVVVPDM